MVATLGEPIEVMTDAGAFEARLVHMAPMAPQKLNPKTWVAIAPVFPNTVIDAASPAVRI